MGVCLRFGRADDWRLVTAWGGDYRSPTLLATPTKYRFAVSRGVRAVRRTWRPRRSPVLAAPARHLI